MNRLITILFPPVNKTNSPKIIFVHALCKGKLNVPSQKSKQTRFAYINSADSITSKKYDQDFE